MLTAMEESKGRPSLENFGAWANVMTVGGPKIYVQWDALLRSMPLGCKFQYLLTTYP